MGGADEAMRHRVERMRGSFFAGAELARTLAGDVAEDAPERAEAVPPGLEGDFGDREVGVAEQRLAALDPAGEQIVRGGIHPIPGAQQAAHERGILSGFGGHAVISSATGHLR